MEKTILGISGGKTAGNTDILVNASLEECEKSGLKTNFLNISKKKINSCLDCGVCTDKPCPQEDDMAEILEALESADGIIIGSPTYFANVSSHISLMMERSLPARRQGFKLKNKVGGAIAVGGSRNGGQEFVINIIQNWFTLHGMIVIADDVPTAHFGGIGTGRNSGDVKEDKVGIQTSQNLGKRMADVVKLLRY